MNGFITKGDNNNAPDGFIVTEEEFVGRVVLTSNISVYVIYALENHLVIIIGTIIVLILITIAVRMLLKDTPRGKRMKD